MSGDPTCPGCGQPYWLRKGCTSPLVAHTYRHGDPVWRERLRADVGFDPSYMDGPCGDCGVEPGEFHHLGCDTAYCPTSGDQVLGCDCARCSDAIEMGEMTAAAARGEIDWDEATR